MGAMQEQPGSSVESLDALLLELPAGCFAHIISYLACLSDTSAVSLACRQTSQQIQVRLISSILTIPARPIGCRTVVKHVYYSPACARRVLEALLASLLIPWSGPLLLL